MVQRSFLSGAAFDALAQENERIGDTYSLPRLRYESWETWSAWLEKYRELVRDVQEIYEEYNGRMRND